MTWSCDDLWVTLTIFLYALIKKKKKSKHLLSTYQAADKIEKYNLTLVDRGNNNWTVFLFFFKHENF